MSFNMNQCKKGDQLLLRNGYVATYIGTMRSYEHHCIAYDMGYVSVYGNGRWFWDKGEDHEFDVVGFYFD